MVGYAFMHTSLTVLNIPKDTILKLLLSDQYEKCAFMVELIYISKFHKKNQ
jgi:hypothetical protein